MKMTRRSMLAGLCAAGAAPLWAAEPKSPADLAATLTPIREKYDLPALAAAVSLAGSLVGRGAVGTRKYGDPTPVAIDDRFHLGSCTKSMTATLVGMLVEEGKLAWDTPFAQSFPELAATMHPSLRDATVAHLLAHRAGLPADTSPQGKTLLDIHALPGTPPEQRNAYVAMILKEAAESAPGARFVYSNRGYILAGAIAERIAKQPWEELIARRLFQPLGMTTAGFGAPGKAGSILQPWGHRASGTKHQPIEPGPLSDNPPVVGPAGRVHCSIGDWAKYAAAHARGERDGGLVKPATYKKLHTPEFGGDYAGGWLTAERAWGGGRVLTHAGSNTLNYAVAWLAPLRGFAVVVATNQGGDTAATACDDAAAALIGRFLK
jgi:CubicO group peptidase (beta-lactamase class C family)